MKIRFALLVAVVLSGCGTSRAERQQQDFFVAQSKTHLKQGMAEREILLWASGHNLRKASDGSSDIILFAPGVNTRWPHFPCANTFTTIRIKLTEHKFLASYKLGRSGVCL